MHMRFVTALAAGVSLVALGSQMALAQAVIDNGTIQLGINPVGSLITSGIGLTYLPTSGEALAPGCACEGWGIGDLNNLANVFGVSQSNGTVNTGNGTASLTVSGTGTDAASTGSSAVSVVDIVMGGNPWAKVTHDFHPAAATDFLYETNVTIQNTGTAAIGNLVYRRAMDWDVPPTAFNEYVTIQGWPATNLVHSSDDGFHSLDINDPIVGSGISPNTEDQNFVDSGIDDHGAVFDFAFGDLAAGASKDFKIYYGAAGDPVEALDALRAVNAEVYSLGMPSNFAPGDPAFGTPNTFIFAFAGVGGTGIGTPVVISSLGLVRQLSTSLAGHHASAVGMRMDGLSSGGENIEFADSAMTEGWKLFGSVGAINGSLSPFVGASAKFSAIQGDIGIDYTFAPMWWHLNDVRLGAAVGTARAQSGGDVGGSTTRYERIESDDNVSVSLFGSARLFDYGDVQAIATISSASYESERWVGADKFTGTAHDNQYRVALSGGYDFPIMMSNLGLGITDSSERVLSAGPLAGLIYTSGTIGDFGENSATRPLSAILFPEAKYSTWVHQLGGRVNYAERINGYTYGATLKAAWEHQYNDKDAQTLATSAGSLPSLAAFDMVEEERARIGLRIHMTAFDDKMTIALEDEAVFGSSYNDNAIRLLVRYRFAPPPP